MWGCSQCSFVLHFSNNEQSWASFYVPTGHPWMWWANSIGKDPDAGKDWGQEEKEATEGEMVWWHYWSNWHEFEQTPGDSEGQGSLACYRPWSHKESDTTEQLGEMSIKICSFIFFGGGDLFVWYFSCWVEWAVSTFWRLKPLSATLFAYILSHSLVVFLFCLLFHFLC